MEGAAVAEEGSAVMAEAQSDYRREMRRCVVINLITRDGGRGGAGSQKASKGRRGCNIAASLCARDCRGTLCAPQHQH